jgi:hypothetical protein
MFRPLFGHLQDYLHIAKQLKFDIGITCIELPFIHTCNHRLKCNTYFRFSHILLQHVPASLGPGQVYTLVLKLLHWYVSTSPMNALLFLV